MTDTSCPSTTNDATDGRSVRRFAMAFMIVVAAAMSFAQVLQSEPLQSANDRSRWATVWSLVERRTFQIDEIDAVPTWSTIDKVRHDGHFYSSKPPLQSVLVAGVYAGVKQVTGWNLSQNTTETARAVLLIVSWFPAVVSLVLLACVLERCANHDFTRLFVLAVACWGTMLNPFVSSLNNHSPAAACLMITLWSLLPIVTDGDQRRRWFLLSGFFAAATFALELPAAIVVAVVGVLLWRTDRRRTLLTFLPAALLPIAMYGLTNWLATGQSLPFYSSYGTDKYLYTHEGIPSYWMNPQGLDRNLDSPLMYFVHCTIGHHGLLSLTPVWLLTLWSWLSWRQWRTHCLSRTVMTGALATLIVFGFYLTRTQNYNYGGNSVALRWMLWLTPFWLLGMVPLLDAWGTRRGMRIVSTALLAVSVVTASLPGGNPWQSSWLFSLMKRHGWVNYEVPVPPFEFQHPLWSWFTKVGQSQTTDRSFVVFQGVGAKLLGLESETGTIGEWSLRLEANADNSRDEKEHRTTEIVFTWSGSPSRRQSVFVNRTAFAEGKKSSEFLCDAKGEPLKRNDLLAAQRLVTGLPQSVEYRPGHIRYLKTPLRPQQAFRCQRASARIMFQPQHASYPLRYQSDLWLCDEIPFGVAQLELTISDPRTSQTLMFQRLTATQASGFE